ncbi:YlmH/Sll1252 family protein [Sporolactobacillus sp. CPB3-1]|uniref:YlmH/Sll1252 family protein n=1 Tax=Sporolactobacillus mangiferae TaxID=2940498 RepID=A0ABT0M7U7_9BACL|nr:YlmH/Sll1252 family protein [Sporolactobacillus mangiferae]MCL1630931.1 YlmH/Sll1252 family protein [Sporolactobacillus mangiferae]
MTVYEHFRPEERVFIDHILDMKERVIERYTPRLTDFLDPRQQRILTSLIGGEDGIRLSLCGGYEHAERKRALLLPPYIEEQGELFRLAYLEVHYPDRFGSITHPELLGSLTGMGVSRDKIGDLLLESGKVQFICTQELASYFALNLTSVGKMRVSCISIKSEDLLHSENKWQEFEGTVSSLRLDTVLSEIYRLPRAKASEAIAHERAKVNWEIVDKRDFDVHAGDCLSLRGFGRSKIISCDGLTKKNKIRIQYGKLK